jgi:hypothetical protein
MVVWRDTHCSADTSYVYTHERAHKSVVWVTSYRSCVEFYALTYHTSLWSMPMVALRTNPG